LAAARLESVPDRFFGELPGLPEASAWVSRQEAAQAGVHRPTVGGISGTRLEGADSICVNGGYEDDQDFGDEIIYTGAGGNDPNTGKQVADQDLDQPGNASLVTSELEGLPIRVLRGSRGDPMYSPTSGFRYDGLYRVAEHWSEIGKSGYRIWRYRLVRLSEQEAAPYVPEPNLPPGTKAPKRTRGVATRVVRTTAVAESIKRLYEYSCQVCGAHLEVPGGTIAEVAHVRGLGRPHNGPDVPENVLCLCPNHHALLDAGGIYVNDDFAVHNHTGAQIGALTRHPSHQIDLEHLRYHRALWGQP